MVVEEFPNFIEWLFTGGENSQPALLVLAGIALVGGLLGVFIGYVVASFRHGPFEAFYVVAQVISEAIPDILGISLRRTWAIARLSIKEAMRRKVILVTFAIFAVTLLFGGWFMNHSTTHPDQIYVNFVLWGTQLLVLLMAMLISAFSLPEDITNKTIYTVVTKPVRSIEIVLGRIVGFVTLGTILLALMGTISFVFVWRGLSHTHRIADATTQTMAEFYDIDPETKLDKDGKRVSANAIMASHTESIDGHRHRIEVITDVRKPDDVPKDMSNVWKTEVRDDGRIVYYRLITENRSGHFHPVEVEGEGENATVSLKNAAGYFRARVPIYADTLEFFGRSGEPKANGINVGKEWEYRGYVDGGTFLGPVSLSEAKFKFKDFPKERFEGLEFLPMELTLAVFRTTKADIEKRVVGSIRFESAVDKDVDSRFVSDPIPFETEEFAIQNLPIERKLPGQRIAPDGTIEDVANFDLFDDYAANGSFLVYLRCEDPNQYLGCARGDIYFRAADDLYGANFLKGYLGIWCQMTIIVSLGVALSTFLNSPVTMMSACVCMIIGFFGEFIRNLTSPDVEGGGPIESLVRLVTQNNMMTPLETGLSTTLIEQTDKLVIFGLDKLTYLAPDFGRLNFSDFLTYGYSIDLDRLLVALSVSLGFCIGLAIMGYFCLKTREIAK